MVISRFLPTPRHNAVVRGPVTTRLSSRPDLTCSFTNQLPAWEPPLIGRKPAAEPALPLTCAAHPGPMDDLYPHHPWSGSGPTNSGHRGRKCVLTPSRKGPVRRLGGPVPCGTPPPGCHDACSGYISAQQGMAAGPCSALYSFREISVTPDLLCAHSSCSRLHS